MVKGDLSMSGFTCQEASGIQRTTPFEGNVSTFSFPLSETLINATPCTFSALISLFLVLCLPLFKYPIDLDRHQSPGERFHRIANLVAARSIS